MKMCARERVCTKSECAPERKRRERREREEIEEERWTEMKRGRERDCV